ncbi:MAG: segregation and condensation protein A [Terracidiphilus sp.]
MEGKIPWWRKVLEFALGGIRSRLGWLTGNGKPHEPAQVEVETVQPPAEPAPAGLEVAEQAIVESEPEPEPHPEQVEVPVVVVAEEATVEVAVPEETAVEVAPVVEIAAPEETEVEVTPLVNVAAEVENQEDESALTESSPQPENPAEKTRAESQPAAASPDSSAASAPGEPTAQPSAAPPEPPSAPPAPIQQSLPLPELTQEQKTAEKVAAMLKARGQDAEQSPFSVIVSQVYDGPLDLLLDLIRKQDIDIYDIPIANITAQFLAYVDRLRESDMDVAGEFIYTAALLIHIKSKMLLPRSPAGPDDAADDPRRELVERLLEHERFKNAAQMLHDKQTLEAATWTNPGMREFREDEAAEPEIAADTTDLVRIFRDILDRARNRPIFNVQEDTVTVGQMIQFLARRLTMEDKPVALRRLLSHTNSERALIAMFLALLEMVRLQAILLRQDKHFSEIFIKKHTGFEAAMNQGLAEARDDWR